MRHLLLGVLLVWAATLVFPDLGDGLRTRAVQVGAWAGERAEGPTSPITNRYRRAQAENDLRKMSRLLTMQRNQGQRAPAPEDLPAFLTRNQIAPDGIDPWGGRYRIAQEADSLAVMSAGPDRQFGTADDLVVRVAFPARSPSARSFRN